MKGKLYVLSGPSGAGKGTLCKAFLAQHPEVALSVSCATRSPRPGEIDGVHYHFITQQEFEQRRLADGFLECACFYGGSWYGTPKDEVLALMETGKDVILEIENNGAQQVIHNYPETISIFLLPPSTKELLNRLVGRGTETLEKCISRMQKVPSELEAADMYNCIIINDTIEQAVADMESIFQGNTQMNEQGVQTLRQLRQDFSDMDACIQQLQEIFQNRTQANE